VYAKSNIGTESMIPTEIAAMESDSGFFFSAMKPFALPHSIASTRAM
jgi:hypothetical protein